MNRRARWAIAIAAPLVHGLMYGAANRYPRVAPTELPLTAFDHAVPFVPDTVWVYLSDYLMVLVAFLICRATLRFTATFAAVIAVSTAVQWLVPIAYPRGLFPVAPAGGLAVAGAVHLLESPVARFWAVRRRAPRAPGAPAGRGERASG